MPQDVAEETSDEQPKPAQPGRQQVPASREWFTTPPPIRRLFDKFPLQTHPPNQLPQRTAAHRDKHVLYIFNTPGWAERGAPSFNPRCLKWQAYLRFQGIDFVAVPSNNHASPTGALPFLLPSASTSAAGTESAPPVSSHRIQRWSRELRLNGSEPAHSRQVQSSNREASDIRYDAYMSLLDHRIRNAYLYSLYLSSPNFEAVVIPLYISPVTHNRLARLVLSYQLRAAAESELLKESAVIDVEKIYRECDKAFEALSELLAGNEFFFGEAKPGLFDASVFAYTHVLLERGFGWKDERLRTRLKQYDNLVQHRKRIRNQWYAWG